MENNVLLVLLEEYLETRKMAYLDLAGQDLEILGRIKELHDLQQYLKQFSEKSE